MARKYSPGIDYYPTDVEMVRHKKIKLLFNEFDSHGPWVLHCLHAEIYRDKGYYMETRDEDSFLLFAGDVCKKPLQLVRDVVAACVKRGLFSPEVYRDHGVLTSDRIQENYLHATAERRRKGTVMRMRGELVLVDLEGWNGIQVEGKNAFVPRNEPENPRKNSHRIEKNRIEKNSKVERENTQSRSLALEKMVKHLEKNAQKYYPAEYNKARTALLQLQEKNGWTAESVNADPAKLAEFQKAEGEIVDRYLGSVMRGEAGKCFDHYAARSFKIGGETILAWPPVIAGWMNKRDNFKKP